MPEESNKIWRHTAILRSCKLRALIIARGKKWIKQDSQNGLINLKQFIYRIFFLWCTFYLFLYQGAFLHVRKKIGINNTYHKCKVY